jgi:protein arginine N-methyltransferase 1
MYSLDQFALMFADRIRMDAYVAAIQKFVKPGDTVVDLGCGPGIFALLACKAGARRVYAIDVNAVIDFGRHLASVNGFSDRIHFLRGDSRQIHLPERADVIISDVRGALPLFTHGVDTIHDARQRFLTEGGQLIPESDTLVCAVIENSTVYQEIAGAWCSVPELNLSSGLPLVLNAVYSRRLKPEQVVSNAVAWCTLDYIAEPKSLEHGTFQSTVLRDCVAHGLGLWFETQLSARIGYSTEPGSGRTVYGHVFLPWLEPVRLREGETCCVDLRAHRVGNDYVWQWETRIPAVNGRAAVHFKQSTFYSSTVSPSQLRKHATDFVPVLSEGGLAERWLLQAMDGKRTLLEIASEAVQRFPHVFRRVEDALDCAAELAEKLSR